MNEHFRGPINTSNNSNMISQNPHSTLQATYFPVSPYDCESSTYSEIILTFYKLYFTKARFYIQNNNVYSSTISSYRIPRKIGETFRVSKSSC